MSELELASFSSRLIAGILDSILIFMPIGLILLFLTGNFSLNATQGLMFNIPYMLYLVIVPTFWRGYVIGKRIVKIRVEKLDGNNLKISDMLVREFLGKFAIGYITLGISTIISAIMVLCREDKRAIHDFLARTFVSHEL